MADRNYWIIGADGKPYGPADLETLRRWISERRVTVATPVATAAEGPWEDAASWTELQEALGLEQPTPTAPPTTGGAVPGAGPGAGSPPPPPSGSATYGGAPGAAPSAALGAWPPTNLQVTLLIAGVCNIVFSAASVVAIVVSTFGLGCCCAFPSAILLVIGVLQCVDYTRAARMTPDAYLDRTRLWGIINVCLFLFGNWPSAVCGLLQLVWLGDARQQLPRR